MNKFNRLRRLLGHAAELTLVVIEGIVAVWIILIPLAIATYCYVRAWRATDPELHGLERFNQVIDDTFWINLMILLLMVALRKFTYWTMKYSRDRQRARERERDSD